jgi:hypothetical protein
MYFLKGVLIVSGIIGSLCFFGPRSNLQNLIQIRGAFSGLRRIASRELLDGSNLLTIISSTNHLHSLEPFVFTVGGFVYWFWIRHDIYKDDKIQNIIPFYNTQRLIRVSSIIFFSLLCRNIENAV